MHIVHAGIEAKKLLKKKFSNKDARRLGNSGRKGCKIVTSWDERMPEWQAASKALHVLHAVITRNEVRRLHHNSIYCICLAVCCRPAALNGQAKVAAARCAKSLCAQNSLA